MDVTYATETQVSRSTIANASQPRRHTEVPVPMRNAPRSVVVIGRQPQLQEALDTVTNAQAYDIVIVQLLEQAYSMVKQLSPDLIVLWLPIDDEHACQVLSMLKLDQTTSRIPLVTYEGSWAPVQQTSMN